MRKPVVAFVGAIALFALLAFALRRAPGQSPCSVLNGPSSLPDLPEASGLALGRRNPGVIWSHNDSGNEEILFALDANGGVVGRVRVPVHMRDWEDISAGRCPSGDCLYLADIGDNRRERPQVRIFRVSEPVPGDPATGQPDAFTAVYEDGAHNAEALFVIGADLFIITRDSVGGLYRSTPSAPAAREITFQRIGQLGLEGVTDAEASPDEQIVAVRTEGEVLLYRAANLVRGQITPYARIPIEGLKEPQGEGIALDSSGRLYLASEGRAWNPAGRLTVVSCPGIAK